MEWFENDEFWRELYPILFHEGRLAAAADEVDCALVLSAVSGGAVLDLCCGPARHAVILAQRGFTVTGVDRSPFLLGKARERIAAIGVAVELVEADMRSFIRPEAFDLTLNLFTSFGYLRTPEEDLSVLQNVRTSLKEGGTFVIDVLSKEFLASLKTRTKWEELPDGTVWIQHFDVLPGWSRIRVRWILIQGGRARHFEFEHNAYSGQELRMMLRSAGFGQIELYGSLSGAPYDVSATRLVAVARRRADDAPTS